MMWLVTLPVALPVAAGVLLITRRASGRRLRILASVGGLLALAALVLVVLAVTAEPARAATTLRRPQGAR